jgi:hypothetical protein
MSLAETHVFSPQLVNEVRVGYNRFFYTASPLSNGMNLGAQYGIPGIPTFSGISGLPSLGTTGLTGIGEALTSHRGQNVRQVLDNISYTSGRHSWKFGFDHRRTEFNLRQGSSSQGSFSYTGVYTNDPTSRAGGQAYADFLLAYPVSASIGTPLDLGFFLQRLPRKIEATPLCEPRRRLNSCGVRREQQARKFRYGDQ